MLKYKDIFLRARTIEDTDTYIRWLTEETEWQQWDAPWENEFLTQQQISTKKKELHRKFSKPLGLIPSRLEVCFRDGTHIGTVNTYFIDNNTRHRAVGIGIRESDFWGRGLGTMAFQLWIAYLFSTTTHNKLYCETWSGNIRMTKLALNCGFKLAQRETDSRKVRGKPYDALTFTLTQEAAQTNFKPVFDEIKQYNVDVKEHY